MSITTTTITQDARPGPPPERTVQVPCEYCEGRGMELCCLPQPNGYVGVSRECPYCAGRGYNTLPAAELIPLLPAEIRTQPAGSSSKYHARITRLDGHTFASRREAWRYQELRLAEIGGAIQDLQVHVPFRLRCPIEDPSVPPREREGATREVARYIADFVYYEPAGPDPQSAIRNPQSADWRMVVEDVKGALTEMYKLKRRWMKAQYGIEIRET